MSYYLISFPGSAMDVPAEEMPAVSDASHAVVRELKEAGALVFAGGIAEDVAPVMVGVDGSVVEDTYPQTTEFDGGFTVIDVATRQEALDWAAKIAVGCRCAQEVREFMGSPAV